MDHELILKSLQMFTAAKVVGVEVVSTVSTLPYPPDRGESSDY